MVFISSYVGNPPNKLELNQTHLFVSKFELTGSRPFDLKEGFGSEVRPNVEAFVSPSAQPDQHVLGSEVAQYVVQGA